MLPVIADAAPAPDAQFLQPKASVQGDRIVIQGRATAELSDLVDTLPNSKWDRKQFNWNCERTLAAAWRVVHSGLLECDPEVQDLANRFDAQLAPISAEQPVRRKLDLWNHQAEAHQFIVQRDAALLNAYMGCVSCDTEYLSPTGWQRIDEYDGGKVAEYDPDTGSARFVQPSDYIKLPCSEMIHLKHTRGLDQMLSEEHRVLWVDLKGRVRVSRADEIEEVATGTQHARFPSTFTLAAGPGCGLTEAQLRVQVALMADGSFPRQHSAVNPTVLVRLLKQPKIERLKVLLTEAGIEFSEKPCKPDGYRIFRFKAPVKTKVWADEFYAKTSLRDREIICDECWRWDGSRKKANAVAFYTTVKKNADFIQFCFASTGRRASLITQDRKGVVDKRTGRVRKSTDYMVHAVGDGRSGNLINFAIYKNPQNAKRVPSPDGFKYCFAVPTSFLVYRRNGCVFCSGNTGKSLVSVATIDNTDAPRVLIVCPTKVRGVWRREFRKWGVQDREVLVLDKESWTVARKQKEAEKFCEIATTRGLPYAVVINYESVWLEPFAKWALSRQWDLVILDESHRIKNPDAKSAKFCHKLGRRAKRRLCLSGTPLVHSPLDAFSQAKFLDPGIFGTSWPRFRDRYAITGAFGSDHIVGYRNQDELSAKLALFTYTAGKDVLKDLPPITQDYLEADLNGEARKLYDALERDLFAEAKSGVITASNALVKLLRLQQITSGSVPVDEVDPITGVTTGNRVSQQLGTEKQDLLTEIVATVPPDEPIVVFCKFREDLDRVAAVAAAFGLSYGEISGRRKDLTEDSTMPTGIKLMGVQLQSGGVGIDLTRACYVVYYSVGYSLGDYEQSLNRCHRPGQTRHTFIYHLLVSNTIDAVVYKALARRKSIIDEVIDYLKAGHPLSSESILAGMAA